MREPLKPPPSLETNKLLGLEALRFLTAVAILVYHYRHFSFVANKPVNLVLERLPFYGLLRPFFDSGAFGVWVFWCISGFIFFWKYRDPIAERAVDGWKFFSLRFSRLYPLHLVTLLAVALLQSAYFAGHANFFVYQNNDLPHFLTQLFMASDWGITHGQSFDGPIWSVSVEVVVYFMFFLLLRTTRSWLLNVAVVAACIGAGPLGVSSQITVALALFFIGGLAAIMRRTVARSRFAGVIETLAWCALIATPPLVWHFASDRLDEIDLPLFLFYTPVVLFCLSREIAMPSALQKLIEAAGNMTYSSYLLHFPLQLAIVLCFAMAGSPVPLYERSLFVVYLLTTLLLSYLTYRYFEAPAQNLLRAAMRRRKGQTQEAFRRASSA
jgi:peptidoglycan/LPS O-acetylase OafA/YrhL